jgi:hypothetical protein
MARKEQQYRVTASVVTPGHERGEILPASAFGDLLQAHLDGGAIEAVDAEEAEAVDAEANDGKTEDEGE